MPPSLLDVILDGPYELRARPEPLAGDLRISWGVAVVVLIIGESRGRKASLQKLHFLAHSIRTGRARLEAERVFTGEMEPSKLVVRVEPWLNRALAFAAGSGLVKMENGKRTRLTQRGLSVLEVLRNDASLLREEKRFLSKVRQLATEHTVGSIMRMEFAL